MRIQSTANFEARGLDAYFTPREAVEALLMLEGHRLPQCIWEPAAGDGAIVNPLLASGRSVYASDIHDYGVGYAVMDYLKAKVPQSIQGVITNPPYKRAQAFAEKALREVPYVALLLRSNWLIEGNQRSKWLDMHGPTKVWLSATRLPMMHRHNWTGKRSTSNTPYCWAVWVRDAMPEPWERFYWREMLANPTDPTKKAA